jgi:hypothetical protein
MALASCFLGDRSIHLAAHGVSFQGPYHAQRGFHLRPRTKIRKVPPWAASTATLAALGLDVREADFSIGAVGVRGC